MLGFWSVEVKVFGPVQLHAVAAAPLSVRFRVLPTHWGLFEPMVKAGKAFTVKT